jgi:16S rRNA (cytidine1402-2'-O)-methyltransferase
MAANPTSQPAAGTPDPTPSKQTAGTPDPTPSKQTAGSPAPTPSTHAAGSPAPPPAHASAPIPASAPAPAGAPRAPQLYLIPTFLDEHALAPLPAYILDAVKECQVFFVENERSARRYLKMLWKEMVIDNYQWYTIHKAEEEVKATFRQKLKEGKTIGIISEAGCPGVADPGGILTAAAHEAGAIVKPLVGPSSILLALMASGLNGQQFRFSGYLPVDNTARTKALRDLEAESQRLNCTQIFIETPYRNNQLLGSILAACKPATRLCIAVNLTGPAEYIRTLPIAQWRNLQAPAGSAAAAQGNPSAPGNPAAQGNPAAPENPRPPGTPGTPGSLPDLHKQPAIFLLLA